MTLNEFLWFLESKINEGDLKDLKFFNIVNVSEANLDVLLSIAKKCDSLETLKLDFTR